MKAAERNAKRFSTRRTWMPMQAIPDHETVRRAFLVKRGSKSASLPLERTSATYVRDNRYP